MPYSGSAVLTEFFDRSDEANGDVWLIVTSTLDDPTYLAQLMTSTHFKREPDGSKWNQRACEVTPPWRGRNDRAVTKSAAVCRHHRRQSLRAGGTEAPHWAHGYTSLPLRETLRHHALQLRARFPTAHTR